jgi:large subunit ribosomal protein L24
MAAAKIRKGDQVVVLSGKDKGKTGEVIRSIPKDMKVVVSGVNVAARHRKASQTNPQGGIERKEAPLHVSKVAIADPKTGQATRVRFETRDGKKVRIAAKSGELIHG